MARSELNSLMDRASEFDDDDAQVTDNADPDGLNAFSERELEAELSRRKEERQAEQRAREERAAGGGSERQRSGAATPRRSSAAEIRRAYISLEVPEGSDLNAVKAAYRKLMRKYHPDKHAGSKEKEKTAHDLSLRLTQAYDVLKRHLGPG